MAAAPLPVALFICACCAARYMTALMRALLSARPPAEFLSTAWVER